MCMDEEVEDESDFCACHLKIATLLASKSLLGNGCRLDMFMVFETIMNPFTIISITHWKHFIAIITETVTSMSIIHS